MFVPLALGAIVVLAGLAIRANRADRHPTISAALWLLALTLLAWTGLVWLVGA